IRNWSLFAACIGLTILSGLANLVAARLRSHHRLSFFTRVVMSTMMIGVLSRAFGPLVMIPTLAAANTISYALNPHRKRRPLVVAIGCCAILVPTLLEWAGVLSNSYIFRDGMMCIVPRFTELRAAQTSILLLVVNLGVIVLGAVFVGRVR